MKISFFVICVLIISLALVHVKSSEVPKNVTNTSKRIHRIERYRIQRRLAEPEDSFEVDYRTRTDEDEDEKRRPRRKLLIYKSTGQKAVTDLGTIQLAEQEKRRKVYRDPLTNKLTVRETTTGVIDNSLETKDEKVHRQGPYGNLVLHDEPLKYRHGWSYNHHPHSVPHHHHQHPAHHGSGPAIEPLPYAIDPASPIALAHTQHNPLAPFHPQFSSSLLDKKKKKDKSSSLVPLDPALFTAGVVVGWLFWVGVFIAYSYFGDNKLEPLVNLSVFGSTKASSQPTHNKMDKYVMDTKLSQLKAAEQYHLNPSSINTKPIIVKIEPGKPPQFFQTARALSGGNGFSFARVLDMIAMAQETYERFDFQSLDCQKKALCELQQKQADFGETGRKISSTFTFFDALQDLPMPTIIQNYLKEYKEAIMQGKNSSKDCSFIYPKCDFSIKDVFVKYSKKLNRVNKDKDM